MGFGFRKSFKVAPGVRLNVSSRGVGASVGVKGLRYSVNSRGQRRTTVSLPGTGLSYTSTSDGGSRTGGSRNYRTSSYQRQSELNRLQKEREKLQEMQRNRLEVDLFENRLEMIKSIHKECDDFVDWQDIKNTEPPFLKGHPGPLEQQALQELQNYRPGFIARAFNQEEKRVEELRNKVLEARKKEEEEYQGWSSLTETATKVLNGDLDTYFEVIKEFAPLDDLSEFGSGFEFFLEEPHIMEVEFDVQPKNIIPTEMKTLTSTGKVSVKNMPISKYYDIQQDYVCSCVLRIARDMFALLPLNTIIIHALDSQMNTSIGYHEKVVVLSVKIDRNTLNRLNFDTIDCSDSMVNFEHKMNFRKTKGFAPVEKIQL
ncbi:DUF4236 domain-containing protein [Neobacillus sp. NPDC097160]|uniref:DUF4236 domain-containing protein n=1 Tax=Neobacillus sp. NPDC097160 TaxID=3364298 RepID=UPI0037F9FCBA